MSLESGNSSDREIDFCSPFHFKQIDCDDPYLSAALICGRCCVIITVSEEHPLLRGQQHNNHLAALLPEDSELYSQYLEFITTVDDDWDAYERFEDWLVKPLIPLLKELHDQRNPERDHPLAEYLRPRFISMSLQISGGALIAVPCERDLAFERSLFRSVPQTGLGELPTDLPLYQDTDLIIQHQADDDSFCLQPTKVRTLHGPRTIMAFKAFQEYNSCHQELKTLSRLQAVANRAALRVPELLGLVEGSGLVYGFLMTYVDYECTLGEMWHRVNHAKPPPEAFRRWVTQVKCTVAQLHEMNLIWGDAKPENVLIDRQMNAWVIDFGGGYSPEWVDEHLHDSVEGDDAAVRKMELLLVTKK